MVLIIPIAVEGHKWGLTGAVRFNYILHLNDDILILIGHGRMI
jgi:hypothetical protein